MPLYDGIGTDKQCVVLEIGHAYTRCGFAREYVPRWIIPSNVINQETKKHTKLWDYKNDVHLYSSLKEFLHTLYFKYLVANPKDRRVVIVESILCPTIFRETLAKVLFVHFEVPSILFVPSHLMAIYTLGISSAVVVDIGYTETVVLPIFEKVPILNAWEAIPLGAEAIHRRLEVELMNKGRVKGVNTEHQNLGNVLNEMLSEATFEDIKVRTCFVTPFERSQALQEFSFAQAFPAASPVGKEVIPPPPPCDVDYPLDGNKILTIPGTLRELAPETLFEQDGDGLSVATILLDSIMMCPIDIRRHLAENVVLMGGSAMLPGFRHRFIMEIKHLLASNQYKSKLPLTGIKVHSPPAKENYVAWLGASLYGATDVVTMGSLTREQYLNQRCLSDWSDQKWIENIQGKSLG